MRYGFYLPTRGRSATPEALRTLVTRGEALGFHSVVIADHVVFPVRIESKYPYTVSGVFPGGGDTLEQLTLATFIAAHTERLRLVTSVMILPHRHPVLAAKMLATLDVLSRGRLTVGVGVGWLREEFEALATPPFEARGAVTDEYLKLMRATWTTDPVRFEGRHYTLRDAHALPKPVQRNGIPIWIGGHTDAAVKRAATLGDAWHPIALRPPGLLLPAEYATRVKQLHAWAQRAGRDPKAVALTLRVPMEVRPKTAKTPAGDRPMFQGTAAEIRDDLRAYETLGVSHVVFDAAHPDLQSVLQNMERFARDVRPVVATASRAARGVGGLVEKGGGSAPATSRSATSRSKKRR
jgi:probable F420-dependent oxidoreductase